MKIGSVIVIALLVTDICMATAEPREVVLEPVCASVEEADTLDDAGRAAARQLLTSTLEHENLLVVETGCGETYRVGHHQIDGQLVVRIVGPRGARRYTNASADRLPAIYRELVRALLAEPAVLPVPALPDVAATTEPTEPSTPSTPPPAPFPTPSVSDEGIARVGLWSARIGLGGAVGAGGVTSFLVGYRHGLGEYSLDVAFGGAGGDGGGIAKLQIEVLKHYSNENRAPYLGGGLSVGSTSVRDTSIINATTYSGGGLGVELSAGYAFARTSRDFQSFLQADLTLPLYTAQGMATTGSSTVYPATFMVSFGIAGRLTKR